MPGARSWIVARLLLQLTVALTALVGADFTVDVIGPDDVSFKDTFGTVAFPLMTEILSVTSPLPNLIMGDETSSPKNKVAFRGSLPNCGLPFTVIGKDPSGKIVIYNGKINVKQTGTDDVSNSVVVKGKDDELNKLLEDLKGDYGVTVVSSSVISDAGQESKIAIVLRDKNGNVIPEDEADEIIKKKLKNGLVKEKPECFTKCKKFCVTALVHDSSKGFLEPGAVKSPKGKAYIGMPTKWEFRCGKDAFKDKARPCGSLTCGAVGKCKTSFDDSSYGICESCTPGTLKNEDRGPKCEILTRSYTGGTGAQSITTYHEVSDNSNQPELLTLNFKFAGKCQKSDDSLCTIVKLESDSNTLVEVKLGRVSEPLYTTATLPSMPRESARTVLRSERFVQQGLWMDVTVVARLSGTNLKTVTVFCTIEPNSECVERTAESSLSRQLSLKDAVVALGGSFDGCFRNLRLNGRIVDLKMDRHNGPVDKTSETCSQQDASCGAAANYLCGDKSVCYGFLGAARKDLCKCKCFGGTRLTNEKVTAAGQCAASCSKDLPIMNTQSSSNSISWAMQSGANIPLPGPSPFSLTFRFRTRAADASQMLQIDSSGSGASKFALKLESDTLQFCVDSNCHAFVPKVVSDGYWHEVQVNIARSQLITRIDDYANVHLLSSKILVNEFKVSMDLPSSCITGVRVAEIYMPTGTTDKTQDDSSTSIKATHSSSGVKMDSTCKDPSSGCSCNAATETCEGIWGDKRCACKPGYTGSGGSCVAPTDNPCKRLSIRCPNSGGTCVKVGSKWQICQ